MATTISKPRKASIVKYIADIRGTYEQACYEVKQNMRRVDLAYHQASIEYLNKLIEYKTALDRGESCTKPKDVQPPVVLAQTESATAFLTQLFLSKTPMFSLVGAPKVQAELEKLEKVISNQETNFMWASELICAIRDLVKYNLCFTEVVWKGLEVTPDELNIFGRHSGISLNTISPYQCIWDTSTEMKHFQFDGLFFETDSYSSWLNTLIKLQALDDPDSYINTSAIEALSKKSDQEWKVFEPLLHLNSTSEIGNDSENWASILASYSNVNSSDESGMGTRKGCRLKKGYLRARDVDLGLGTDTAFKVREYILLNSDTLVYFKTLEEPVFNVILGMGIVDNFNYNTQALVASTINYQQTASDLIVAKLSAAQRAIFDRGVYNPLYVASRDLKDLGPAGKIPIRPNKRGDPDAVKKAYQPIPYRDNSTGYLQDAVMFMNDLPSDATGVSKFRQQPQKGNRSATEFSFLSDAGDGRLKLFALLVEASYFSNIKSRVKSLVLSNQPADDKIDYAALENEGFDFKVHDGLTSLGILEQGEFLKDFLQLGAQNPRFASIVGNVLEYILQTRTNINIKDFELDPVNPEVPNQDEEVDGQEDTETAPTRV